MVGIKNFLVIIKNFQNKESWDGAGNSDEKNAKTKIRNITHFENLD